MYATLKEFKQDKVNNYYIKYVADIVDRIGYIAGIFKKGGKNTT